MAEFFLGEGSKQLMQKPFSQTVKNHLLPNLATYSCYHQRFDENFMSVSLEDISHVRMYCISLETQS